MGWKRPILLSTLGLLFGMLTTGWMRDSDESFWQAQMVWMNLPAGALAVALGVPSEIWPQSRWLAWLGSAAALLYALKQSPYVLAGVMVIGMGGVGHLPVLLLPFSCLLFGAAWIAFGVRAGGAPQTAGRWSRGR
ncbi:DUF3995 domain-containing protein [Prescottella defluvii]|uniref:hypothetical protein n=1 Tax=Prescottella defluvii TaxID=1323361 RepID=UPI0004F3623A|nr:hypothetical protein [Prescottella defluvii]